MHTACTGVTGGVAGGVLLLDAQVQCQAGRQIACIICTDEKHELADNSYSDTWQGCFDKAACSIKAHPAPITMVFVSQHMLLICPVTFPSVKSGGWLSCRSSNAC